MRFLSTELNGIAVPREWTPAVVDLELSVDQLEYTRVFLNNVETPVSARRVEGEGRLTFDWPRLGPGRYIIDYSTGIARWSETVTLKSSKLGDDRWWSMLSDLQNRLATSIAVGIQRLGGLAGYEILESGPVTLNAEITRIHRALHGDGDRPGLLQIVPEVIQDPHTRLSTEDRLVRVHQARNMPPHLLQRSLRKVDAAGVPERVIDRRHIVSVNTYENQIVRLFLLTAQNRLSQIKQARTPAMKKPSQIDERIAALDADIRRLVTGARNWLNSVDDLGSVPATLTMVILKRPVYRASMEGYLDLHRQVSVHSGLTTAQATLENTPVLYQQWCSLVVVEQLLNITADSNWKVEHQSFITRDSRGLLLQLPRNGHPVLILRNAQLGYSLTLTFEPSYSSTSKIQSLSFEQKPDIVLHLTSDTGDQRLLVLDPKYKLDSEDEQPNKGRPLKVDIDKMHAYRDAIVDENGYRIVTLASILYPGLNSTYGPDISAIQFLPGGTEINERVHEVLSGFLHLD